VFCPATVTFRIKDFKNDGFYEYPTQTEEEVRSRLVE